MKVGLIGEAVNMWAIPVTIFVITILLIWKIRKYLYKKFKGVKKWQ